MQQMQEPEGQAYNAGYQAESDYSEPEQEQIESPYQPYEGGAFQQQKLHPPRKASMVLAVLSIIASSIIMACAIVLFVMTLITFISSIHGEVPTHITVLIFISFIFSILLFVCSIPAFVFSIIQATLMRKQFPHQRR